MKQKTVGELIREARNAAGMTQAQLAEKIDDLSVSDLGKAERNEKNLSKEQLKSIAKATGVTQKSLLEAPSGVAASGKKTESGKGNGSSSANALQLTRTEIKLVELYRAADSDTRKAAIALLKNEKTQMQDILGSILGNTIIMDAVSGFLSKE